MRAVTGSVASSKLVSVSKAAAILSRFAAAETGARRDVAAYLKRASAAFDELVRFHREVRYGRKRPESGGWAKEEGRKKKRAGGNGDPNPREVEGNLRGRPEREIKGIREVEEKKGLEDGGDGNLTEVEDDRGGGAGSGEDGKRNNMKKGVNDEKERSDLGRRNEKKMEMEGERRKEEKKRSREMGEERRDGGWKKRRNSDDDDEEENQGRGLDDQSERHKKKRRRRNTGMVD